MQREPAIQCETCGREFNLKVQDAERLFLEHQHKTRHTGKRYLRVSYEGLPLAREWSKYPYVQAGGKK